MVVATAIETSLKEAQRINDCYAVPSFIDNIQQKFDALLIKLCTEFYVAAKDLRFDECDKIAGKISDKMFEFDEGKWRDEQ
jgi:hypothetical protein